MNPGNPEQGLAIINGATAFVTRSYETSRQEFEKLFETSVPLFL